MAVESIEGGMSCDAAVEKVRDGMFGHFETDPERLEAARMMFDLGTKRLYAEIEAKQG